MESSTGSDMAYADQTEWDEWNYPPLEVFPDPHELETNQGPQTAPGAQATGTYSPYVADSALADVIDAEYTSEFGWHIGPIPNPKLDWIGISKRLERLQTLRSRITSKVVKELEDAGRSSNTLPYTNPLTQGAVDFAPQGSIRMSNAGPNICFVLISVSEDARVAAGGVSVDGIGDHGLGDTTSHNIMCGRSFGCRSTLRTHLRLSHPGAVQDLDLDIQTEQQTMQCPDEEEQAGELALKKFILMGQWARAKFYYKPTLTSYIGWFCDALEQRAAVDEAFHRRWGKYFHRSSYAPKTYRRLLGIPRTYGIEPP